MEDVANRASAAALAPVPTNERIHALDIVRGFALIGIFLMNVEWFTRPITFLGSGVDPSLSGIDYAASWGIYTFVQGKFWTLFSLLFGMGFAVMLGRAESADRAFVTPYVRRIIGLFLFGSAHFVVLWTGDILHNYAVTAVLLLLIVTRSWKAWWSTLASVAAIGGAMFAFDAKFDSMVMTAMLLLVVALFMFFIHRGGIARYWKFGVALYSLPMVLGLVFFAVKPLLPEKPAKEVAAETAKQDKQLAERIVERNKEAAEETRIYSQAGYLESVRHRAVQYQADLPDAAGLSVLALPMFLIGFWFVRAGVVAEWRRHLPLFRRIASWTLPLGLAMTFYSVWSHPSFSPGDGRETSTQIARVLFQWAALPLSIGYFSAVICLLGTDLGSRILSPLRFAGQMALSNYIGATIAGTFFFSGYGLGYWGQVGRAGQVLFVLAVFGTQLVISYFWLKAFRYGPLEWLWRAITYWTLPPMRREPASSNPAAA